MQTQTYLCAVFVVGIQNITLWEKLKSWIVFLCSCLSKNKKSRLIISPMLCKSPWSSRRHQIMWLFQEHSAELNKIRWNVLRLLDSTWWYRVKVLIMLCFKRDTKQFNLVLKYAIYFFITMMTFSSFLLPCSSSVTVNRICCISSYSKSLL